MKPPCRNASQTSIIKMRELHPIPLNTFNFNWMKTKHITLIWFAILIIHPAFSQPNNRKMGTIILAAATIEQDSAMATHPILYSDIVDPGPETPDITSQIGESTVKFYAKSNKGAILAKFEQLPQGVKPQLEIWYSQGNMIKTIKTIKAVNVLNLRTLPQDTYLLLASINNEWFSWDVIKE